MGEDTQEKTAEVETKQLITCCCMLVVVACVEEKILIFFTYLNEEIFKTSHLTPYHFESGYGVFTFLTLY